MLARPGFREGSPGLEISTNSPAVHAGVNLGYQQDFEGRPVHEPPSLGALEPGK